MARINIPTHEQAPEKSRPLLDAVKAKLGSVPNLFRIVSHSPAALEGFLNLSGSLERGALDAKTRTRIAIAVAKINGCSYCLAAHCFIGKHLALAEGLDLKADAAVAFAKRVAEGRGEVSASDLARTRELLSEAQIVEVIAHVALNVLTNYVNKALETDIDFPGVEAA